MDKSKFVFIGGVPRSGTSLLQKMLDLHPSVKGGPEFDHLPRLCKVYASMRSGLESGRQSMYYNSESLRNHWSQLIFGLLTAHVADSSVTLLSEKTPENALVFNELLELFPDSKFVFVVRDPRGIISSFKKVAQRAKSFGDHVDVGHNLHHDLKLINRYIKSASKFQQQFPTKVHLLNYEDLILQPQATLNELCGFLGIDFSSEMLDLSVENESSRLINEQHKSVRAWSTPGMLDKGIQPTNSDRWKNELPQKDIDLISNFFSKRNYSCFRRYNLASMPKFKQLLYLPYYLRAHGVFIPLKRMLKWK